MDAATHQRGKCLATARLHTTVFDPASHSSQPDFCRIFPLLLPALPAATLGCIHMGSFIRRRLYPLGLICHLIPPRVRAAAKGREPKILQIAATRGSWCR